MAAAAVDSTRALAALQAARIPRQRLTFARPEGKTQLRQLPFLLNTLSQPPHFPHSLSVLGTLLAPLVMHNHALSTPNYLADRFDPAGARPRARGRKDESLETELPGWSALNWYTEECTGSLYSTRHSRLLGMYPGRKEGEEGTWAVAVLDRDSSLDHKAGPLDFKFYASTEGWLLRESGRWRHNPSTGALDDLGDDAGKPETPVFHHHTIQLLNQLITELSLLRRPIIISSISQLYLPAIERIVDGLRIRPTQVKRKGVYARFVLPPQTPGLSVDVELARAAIEKRLAMQLRPLFKSDLPLLLQAGATETKEYLLRNLLLSSAFRLHAHIRYGAGSFLAYTTINNDLSLNTPIVLPSAADFQLSDALLQHSSRQILAALTTSPIPTSQSAHLLKRIEPDSPPLHARVRVNDDEGKALFRRLGWKEVIGGCADVELDGWEERDEWEWRAARKERRMGHLLGTQSADQGQEE